MGVNEVIPKQKYLKKQNKPKQKFSKNSKKTYLLTYFDL